MTAPSRRHHPQGGPLRVLVGKERFSENHAWSEMPQYWPACLAGRTVIEVVGQGRTFWRQVAPDLSGVSRSTGVFFREHPSVRFGRYHRSLVREDRRFEVESHLRVGQGWLKDGWSEQPGYSVFLRDDDRVFHTDSMYAPEPRCSEARTTSST